MLSWAITFFVLALVAAIFGFTGIAKVLLFLFVIGFIVSLIMHSRGPRSPRDPLV